MAAAADALTRRDTLAAYASEVAACTRCRLAQGRTQVVFGVGDPDAELMFVGEAPGFHEDKQGYPFVGQAGKLLERLLAGIGLTRGDVYVANVIKCLRYDALVQLGDGRWERIGRLVRTGYAGTVMSVDDQGRLVPRRVTGWHESPLGNRRVFQLTYRGAKNAGKGRVGIQLTGDHEVLTERGFVPVEGLTSIDRVATGQGLTDLEFDVVSGTLLGDGCIGAGRAALTFAHSERQHDYALFKAELLRGLSASAHSLEVAAVVGGVPRHPVVHVRTRAHRALRLVRRDFYGTVKRVPPWIEEKLNERMLAMWFMDHGDMRIRPNRQPLAEIATISFSQDDVQVLLRALARLGLPAKSLRKRIFFDTATTKVLSERIAPYVPPSMRYKLHPDVEARIPFDPSALNPGHRKVIFDHVELEDVTERPRTDTTFFCIDVEETHNFVTAGGVVHNCRPPGNRDPMPDEIEACESHLFRQLELVQPRLVATLGNFATKLLSGKPHGITRVHGTPQPATVGGRAITLYPIYHPAAALYTPAMLKTLEEDFARIPALLAPEPVAPSRPPAPVIPFPAHLPEPVAGSAQEQLGLF